MLTGPSGIVGFDRIWYCGLMVCDSMGSGGFEEFCRYLRCCAQNAHNRWDRGLKKDEIKLESTISRIKHIFYRRKVSEWTL